MQEVDLVKEYAKRFVFDGEPPNEQQRALMQAAGKLAQTDPLPNLVGVTGFAGLQAQLPDPGDRQRVQAYKEMAQHLLAYMQRDELPPDIAAAAQALAGTDAGRALSSNVWNWGMGLNRIGIDIVLFYMLEQLAQG